MRRSTLIMILCLALAMACSVTGTLAFMTDRDSETNVFTVGDVKIGVTEEYEQGATLVPGVEQQKEVAINNNGSTPAYVWVTVSVPSVTDGNGDVHELITPAFINEGTDDGLWAKRGDAQTVMIDGMQHQLYTFLYNGVLPEAGSTAVILESITMNPGIDYEPAEDTYYLSAGTETLPIPHNMSDGKVYVNAYAIQSLDWANAEEAYTAYMTQWTADGQWDEKLVLVPEDEPAEPENP